MSETVNFDIFWRFLIEEAGSHDAYWLDSWLEDALEKYRRAEICPECSHRGWTRKNTWSKTGNWVLETRTICSNCGHVIKVQDRKKAVLEALRKGDVLLKDTETLREELGL